VLFRASIIIHKYCWSFAVSGIHVENVLASLILSIC